MPSEDHPISFRELVSRLKKFGVTESKTKSSGVVRKFVGMVEGRKQGFPLHVHNDNMEIDRHYLRAIRDRFKIPADQFYA